MLRHDWARGKLRLELVATLSLAGGYLPHSEALAQTVAPARPKVPAPLATTKPVGSQVQVSRQFLRALLRGDHAAAYGQLAPEVRRTLGTVRFRQLAQPVVAQGQRRGSAIELYKLGLRLGEAGAGSQPFTAWAWAADSASEQRVPAQWLEVTFRDAGARQVLGFSLRKR